MIDKRVLVELALAAGQKYLSPQTGLIHFCFEDEQSTDTIPLCENLCYCLTLFRTFVGASIQEGKERLRHLLAFRMKDGHFPRYLHSYPAGPRSHDAVYPLFFLHKYFHAVIEKPLRTKICEHLDLPPPPSTITSSVDAGRAALHSAALDQSLRPLSPYWDAEQEIYCGPLGEERQRKGELEMTLFDLFMGSSNRLKKPHPIHLRASLVFSPEGSTSALTLPPSLPPTTSRGFHLHRKVWREKDHLHTLVCQSHKLSRRGDIFTYPVDIPDEKHRMEWILYTDRHPNKTVLINQKKGTIFRLGDVISIATPVQTLHLTFQLVEGSGKFIGHVSFGNRPAQVDPNIFAAHDWKIGVRTLERSPRCKLQLLIEEERSSIDEIP